jgi:hypothetical protein
MVTKQRFAQGMTFQQYLDQMTTNKYMEQKQLELRRQLRAEHGDEWRRAAAEEIRALLG